MKVTELKMLTEDMIKKYISETFIKAEKKESQKFNQKEVAPAFAKGLRNIYGSKLVFETFEEVDLAMIEKKYKPIVKELSTELKLPKTKLTTKDEFDLVQIENAQPLTKEECEEVNLL
ncbi:hypothetical protein FQA39_LY12890 [Lamprigera yunnana]|nr:hypothetical protein FQA39_LY12890 [Lamprigera yunnana]